MQVLLSFVMSLLRPEHRYWLVLLLRFLQRILDSCLSFLCGYRTAQGWDRDVIRAGRSYAFSAQVVRILAKGSYASASEISKDNFLYVHEKYVRPSYILERDHVTLFVRTLEYAVFVVTERDVNMYDTKKFPFLSAGQAAEARKLVFVPTWAMRQLAEEIGDPLPEVELVSLAFTARCGSTLLCQMFANLPGTLVMTEPRAMFYAHKQYNEGLILEKDYMGILKDIMRVQFKMPRKSPCKRIVVKLFMNVTPQVKMLQELFPRMRIFFNTRHPGPTAASVHHCLQSPIFATFHKYLHKQVWYDGLPFDYDNQELTKALVDRLKKKRQRLSHIQDWSYLYAGGLDYYLRHKDQFVTRVLYEDLVSDPEGEVRRIFSVLGLPEDQVPLALAAMGVHSQGHFFGDPKKEIRGKLTEKDIADIDGVLEEVGVPVRTGMRHEEFSAVFS